MGQEREMWELSPGELWGLLGFSKRGRQAGHSRSCPGSTQPPVARLVLGSVAGICGCFPRV